jgi:hypothetical protein
MHFFEFKCKKCKTVAYSNDYPLFICDDCKKGDDIMLKEVIFVERKDEYILADDLSGNFYYHKIFAINQDGNIFLLIRSVDDKYFWLGIYNLAIKQTTVFNKIERALNYIHNIGYEIYDVTDSHLEDAILTLKEKV